MAAADLLADALAAHRAGRLDVATSSYRQLLAADPENADLRHLLALTLHGADPLAAQAELRRALSLAPPTGLYLHNAARLSGTDEAAHARFLARALALDPTSAEAQYRLGALAGRAGRHARAASRFRRALALLPAMAESWHGLGMAHTNNPAASEDAVIACERAIGLSPEAPEPYLTLALARLHQGRLRDFMRARRIVLALSPGDAQAHWDFLPYLHLDPDLTPEDQMAFRRRVHRRFSDPLTRASAPHANDTNPDRRLKIGYVDNGMLCLSTHSNILLPLIEAHDPKQVALYFYTNLAPAAADDITTRYRAMAAGFRHTGGLSDQEVAHLVRADGIDILIDICGHLTGTRTGLFAAKPAPIQAIMLQVGSSGLAAMDYAIADPVFLPANRSSYFAEAILPSATGYFFQVQADKIPSPAVAPSDRPPTFGSFNQLPKCGDAVLALWIRVLDRVPASRLIMKASGLASSTVRQRVRAFFEARGIAADRLDLRAWARGYGDHLAAFNEVDVVLDCFPYPGITTSLEALLMGVPVVALDGSRFVSRFGGAILEAVGHPEWLAKNEGDYVAIAAGLAGDRARLAGLKGHLRGDLLSSPIAHDPGRISGSLEAGFREAWRRWCANHSMVTSRAMEHSDERTDSVRRQR